jgi:hypothetical protein
MCLIRCSRAPSFFFYAGPRVIRTLAGSVRVTNPPPGKDRKADRYDVGVLRLLEPASPPDLPVNKTALPLSALMPRAPPRRGKEYLVTGFRASKSKLHPVRREIDAGFYGNWCPSASEPAYAKMGLSLEDHIVMPFSRKKVVGEGSIIRAFPNPEGMSRSPVWLLGDEAGTNDPVQTPIVGVLIEYHRSQHLLVATDINTTVELLKAFDA